MNSISDTPVSPQPQPPPRRFLRSSTDRIVGGVCGGLARYFGIDPMIVRIAFVALALFGGTGLLIYAAALLLVPTDEEEVAEPRTNRDRAVAVAMLIAAGIAGSFGFFFGVALFPLGLLLLGGLAVWWFASGEHPSGNAGQVVRNAAKGLGIMFGCVVLAVGSFLAAGLGGGAVAAGLVITAGAGLVVAAFIGGARWLVLPALAIALPLAFVSAAGLDLDGGFGDRTERPGTTAEIKSSYRLGAGELVIDLRDVKLPAGDRALDLNIGAGHALVLVSEDVCVASRASVGMGAVGVFDRESAGVDVDWNDARRAPKGTPRLVIDGDVGLGYLEVRHDYPDYDNNDGPPWGENRRGARSNQETDERNAACTTSIASSGASNG